MTFRSPNLSAYAPATGCARPQKMFWMARARENDSRLHPRSVVMGTRRRPKLVRIPFPTSRITLAQTSTMIARRMLAAD